jgi:hypothetical protein
MINQSKWINSLPNVKKESDKTIDQIDYDKWINTIPKQEAYNSVTKYTFLTVFFICGLIFVSIVKNETRNLQKEINNLESSLNSIKFNLDQAFLDHEIITSPENISLLARKHLNIDFSPYKRSQIKQLNNPGKNIAVINKTKVHNPKKLYSRSKSISDEIKTHVSKRIEAKKEEIVNLYQAPESVIDLKKAGRWGVIQLVKAFLGMPIIPGR